MPRNTMRKARVEEPISVIASGSDAGVLQPGEYLVEEAGATVRLHPPEGDSRTVAEVRFPDFDAWLDRRQIVFISWG